MISSISHSSLVDLPSLDNNKTKLLSSTRSVRRRNALATDVYCPKLNTNIYYKKNYQADELFEKLKIKFNPIIFPSKNDNYDEGFILAVVCSGSQVDIVRKALSEKLDIPLPKWNKALKFKQRAGI